MKFLWIFVSFLLLSGCSSMSVKDYRDNTPKLILEEYFQGNTTAHGVFQDRFGKVRRQFTVDINGTWDAEKQQLTLVEDFIYDDGETEQRVWTLNKTADNKYEGSAEKVVGIATGETAGNAFNWKYVFDLPVEEGTWRVRFDDWMYLQADGKTMFNKATISKWGLRLGDVYIFFLKNET